MRRAYRGSGLRRHYAGSGSCSAKNAETGELAMLTPEQAARDLLLETGIEGAESFSSGDVLPVANLISEVRSLRIAIFAMLDAVHDAEPGNIGEYHIDTDDLLRAWFEARDMATRALRRCQNP